jgi:putative RecB family exonuclease
MGTIYSISRIGTFEDCRLRYKYQYVDRLKADKETIEAFMGSRAHEALAELYGFVKNGVIKPRHWLLARYDDLWDKNLTPAVKVVRSDYTEDDYRRKGRKCLDDYYGEYAPFDLAKVVATEKEISFKLKDGNDEISFRGIIDRLDWNDKEKIYEIHDYKTSGSLPTQADADRDDQLGLYHIAVRSLWPDIDRVKLIWHYLLFNKRIESSRTQEKLAELEKAMILKVKEIEACADYPPKRSALCDWCGFQDICPEWKHPEAMKKLPENEYLKDEGVVLVAKYAELEEKKKELKKEIEGLEAEEAKVEEAAFAFAKKNGVRVIDGQGFQLTVSEKEETCAPMKKEDEAKWTALRELLIREGKYQDVSTVNNNMLNARLRTWGKDFYEKVKAFLITRITKSVYLKKK